MCYALWNGLNKLTECTVTMENLFNIIIINKVHSGLQDIQ